MLLTQRDGLIMGPLCRLLGWILNGIYNLLSSVGIENIAVCIIIFTFFVRLCMYPLSLKSTKSSKIQQHLQPEFKKIYKKYKGKKDQASMMKQNQEIQELQKEYGIKMTSGCLTSLIQIPIFFSLYYVIQNIPAYVDKVRNLFLPIATAIDGDSTHFTQIAQFVKDNKIAVTGLTETNYSLNNVIDVLYKCSTDLMNQLVDSFHAGSAVITQNIQQIHEVNSFIFGINMAEVPGFRLTWALLVPIASLVFQYLSMTVMPMQSTGDPQQDQSMNMMRTMTKIMPIFSFMVCINVPVGVGLYWAIGALISFLTTYFTNLYFDHCDMDRIVEKAKEKAAKKIARDKAKGKKSFMDRLSEAAGMQNEESQPANMEKITSTRLKNYTSSTSVNNSSNNAKYKPGSIAAKANALKQYNEKGGKE